MQTDTKTIDPGLTVNDVLRRYPETIAVFNEFGIDSCCGSGATLDIAAQRDGADLEALLARLNEAVRKS